ncbi:MAG: ABC transporter permease [Spirochaetota bacterium]
MKALDLLREALGAIARNKSRTALTLLGIVIGVGSVVTVVGVGDGAKRVIGDLLGSFGSRSIIVLPNQTAIRESEGRFRPEEITREDIRLINQEASAVAAVTPQIQTDLDVAYGNQVRRVRLMGTLHHYLDAQGMTVARGRFLRPEDDTYMQKVGVLGAEAAEGLFGAEDPVGKSIDVGDITQVEVIGVLEQQERSFISTVSDFDTTSNNTVFVPASTVERVGGSSEIFFLIGEARTEESIDEAKRQILNILTINHGRWDGRHEKFAIQEMGAVLDTIDTTTATLTAFITIIAAIALLVAGIGIMNIMLVSVKERTREIGTRKALGAKQASILNQFVVETLLICGGGGILGVGLAAVAIEIIARISEWPALVSWGAVQLSVILSLVTGLVFGLYPASRAARMDPVEALRYE